jgi:hypothetical protein
MACPMEPLPMTTTTSAVSATAVTAS